MFPRELVLEILLILQRDRSYSTLSVCALVCKEWLPFAREVLYQSDAFVIPFPKQKWKNIKTAIRNPAVAVTFKRAVVDAYERRGVLSDMEIQTKFVLKHGPNIQRLEMIYSRWKPLERLIPKLGTSCQNVTSLHLDFIKKPESPSRTGGPCDASQLLLAFEASPTLRPTHVRYSYMWSHYSMDWRFTRPFPFRLVKAELLRCHSMVEELPLLLGDSTETLHSLVLDSYCDLSGGWTTLALALKPFSGCLRELSLLQCELGEQYREDEPFAMETLIGLFPSLELLDIEGFVIVSSTFLETSLSTSIKSLRLVPFDKGIKYINAGRGAKPEERKRSRLYPPLTVDSWIKFLTGERSQRLERLELGLPSRWSEAEVERIKVAASPTVEFRCFPAQNRPHEFGVAQDLESFELAKHPGCMHPRPCIPSCAQRFERKSF